MKTQKSIFSIALLLIALTAVSGCNKKTAPLPPAEEAPAATSGAPTAQLTATPTVISAGDQAQLSWKTTNASSISIDGIGDVPSVGVKTVTPTESTTYHLVARGEWRVGRCFGVRDRECAAGDQRAQHNHERRRRVQREGAADFLRL